jgi:hypothetical protein
LVLIAFHFTSLERLGSIARKTEDSDSTEKVHNLEVMLHLIKVDVADMLNRESNLPALLTAPANHTLKPTSATVACARWITTPSCWCGPFTC